MCRIFRKTLLNWDLSDIFLLARLEVWVLGRKTRSKAPLSSRRYQRHIPWTVLLTADLDRGWGQGYPASPQQRVLLLTSPSILCSSEGPYCGPPLLKEWVVTLHLLHGRASTDMIRNSAQEIWVTSYKVRHTLVIQPSNATPTYVFKRNNNLGSHKNPYTNVSSDSIRNHQKQTTTQCPPTGGWLHTVGYLHEGLPLSNKILLHVTPQVALRHAALRERRHSPTLAYGLIPFIRRASGCQELGMGVGVNTREIPRRVGGWWRKCFVS